MCIFYFVPTEAASLRAGLPEWGGCCYLYTSIHCIASQSI